MYKVSIPEISEDEMWARYQHAKPIIEIGGKKYFLRDYTREELTSSTSYICNREEDIGQAVDMTCYRHCTEWDFDCIHKNMYVPSIVEVLAQLDPHIIIYVDAFEIIKPSTYYYKSSDENQVIYDNGFLISRVGVYTNVNNSVYSGD